MSRYPTPGTWTTCWLDDYAKQKRGEWMALVIGTSRHRRRLTVAETTAEVAGRESFGGRWRSVTASDIEWGDVPEEVDPGGWCETGSGSAWVDVEYVMVEAYS